MDIDQHPSIHSAGQTRPLDLARLENDVAVRQKDGRSDAVETLQHCEGARVEPLGERVIDEKGRHGQQLYLARVFVPVALERADIVAITQLREQILQDRPIALAGGSAKSAIEMLLEILLDPIVVEERVVYVEEEDDRMRRCHAALPARLCRQRLRQAAGLPG